MSITSALRGLFGRATPTPPPPPEVEAERRRAEEMCHLFLEEYPGQTRGLPCMHSSIIRLHQLGAFEEAEVIAARISDLLVLRDRYRSEVARQEAAAGGIPLRNKIYVRLAR